MYRTPKEIIDRYKEASRELESLVRTIEPEWTRFVVDLHGYVGWPPSEGLDYFLGIVGNSVILAENMPEDWLDIPLTALTDIETAKFHEKSEKDRQLKKQLEQELIRKIQETDRIKDQLKSL